jgi:hypothetical protein
MERRDAERLRPGDEVIALSVDGPLPMRVVEGPTADGDFEVMVLCEPKDWKVVEACGTPGDEWNEWRTPWPIEAIVPSVAPPE